MTKCLSFLLLLALPFALLAQQPPRSLRAKAAEQKTQLKEEYQRDVDEWVAFGEKLAQFKAASASADADFAAVEAMYESLVGDMRYEHEQQRAKKDMAEGLILSEQEAVRQRQSLSATPSPANQFVNERRALFADMDELLGRFEALPALSDTKAIQIVHKNCEAFYRLMERDLKLNEKEQAALGKLMEADNKSKD